MKRTNICCGTMFSLSLLLAITNQFINDYRYNHDALRCLAEYYPTEKYVQLFIMASTMFFVLLPLVVTIIVYGLIIRMVVVRSKTVVSSTTSSGSHSWQAIKTTLLIVGVYLFSTLPFIFSRLYTLATDRLMPVRFRLFCTGIYMLNTAVNPYVYMLSNRSLRDQGKSIFRNKIKDISSEGSQTTVTKLFSRRSWRASSVSNFRFKANPDTNEPKQTITPVEETSENKT